MRTAALAVSVVLLVTPAHGEGQSCSGLPLSANELWIGAASLKGGESPAGELGFDFSLLGRLAVSGSVGTGGFDVSGNPSWSSIRLGGTASVGPLEACLFVGTASMEYSFRDRHEVDRGAVVDELRNVGFRLGAHIMSVGGLEVDVWAAPDLSRRTWEMQGRRLVVQDDVRVEEVRRIDVTWQVAGEGGLSLRWCRLGLSVGVARRPTMGTDLLTFLRVGIAAMRLPAS
jgi:hypothetical protein